MQLSSEMIDFNAMSQDEVTQTLDKLGISLSPSEINHIQNDILKRPPTLTECLLWSIEGSEHCSYKSSKHLLKQLPTKAPNLILGVGEDAAVVSVAKDKNGLRYGIAISHESHNHPSQIVPFEGAATGVGGNVRDIACMGATVIALADALRFGDYHHHKTQWLNKEVVSGIAAYGNALGIPNIAGDVAYHPDYQQNCLVTVVSLGIVREDKVIHSYVPDNADGYALILIGKPTDNSGFGGASFASNKLDEEEANRGAVQEPNAFLERHLLKANQALIERFDAEGVLQQMAFKDLGAGGIGCASVELADGNGFGCEVNLDKVHVGMQHLHPSVVLCAETQERFMWAVPQEWVETVLHHYNVTFDLPNVSYGAKASEIGQVTTRPQYVVSYQGEKEVDALANAVTEGLSAPRESSLPTAFVSTVSIQQADSLQSAFETVLSHPNVASTKGIYDHYDKQVQGRTVIERGLAKAGVLSPFNSSDYPKEIQKTGIALSVSQNPLWNQLDPYIGSQKAVMNALERVAATGNSPQVITDCLCYGNPEIPEHMWAFEQGVQGIKKACESYALYETPDSTLAVAAGNVSFYNATDTQSIPPSPMISCLGRMNEVDKSVGMALKSSESDLYLLRSNSIHLAGSIYGYLFGYDDTIQPLDLKQGVAHIHFILSSIEKELIQSCNTIDEGGLAVALSVMSIISNIGVVLTKWDADEIVNALFAESGGFVFEVLKQDEEAFKAWAQNKNVNPILIGHTQKEKQITLSKDIEINIDKASEHWYTPIKKALI